MKHTLLIFLLLLIAQPLKPVAAQDVSERTSRSAGKAFALSLALPGLGHRYAHGGNWNGAATVFALADGALWLAVLGNEWRHGQMIDSYQTLAAGRAAAYVDGKDREFFLNLATFRSSDDYLEIQLRDRAWSEIDYVSERAYQWEWQTEEDFRKFRSLREDAESLLTRQPSGTSWRRLPTRCQKE